MKSAAAFVIFLTVPTFAASPASPTAKPAATTPAKPSAKPAAKTATVKPRPKTTAPKTIAPPSIAHGNAMFLASLCSAGKQKVTLKAQALGTRFFLEEPSGVTVYAFDGNGYQKENFFKGLSLDQAVKRYRAR
ncbi:MAG: hypothetical protein JOZ54_20740 [Acidobacteria bacterium]|nr:hypothetical protein [Acidobacteriota bacterium]